MSDWLKIVLGAILGFVLGILAEPLKKAVNRNFEMHSLRRIFYKEIGKNFRILEDWEFEQTSTTAFKYYHHLPSSISTKASEELLKLKPLETSLLPEIEWIRSVLESLTRLQKADDNDDIAALANAVIAKIQKVMFISRRRKNLLLKYMPQGRYAASSTAPFQWWPF